MIQIIHSSNQKARKKYIDDSWLFLKECDGYFPGATFAELREMVRVRNNGGYIMPGDMYLRQFNSYDGDTWTYRASPILHQYCWRTGMYDNLM